MTMAKNTTTNALSANAKAIVNAFIHKNIFEPHRANALVIELYSRREGADQSIAALAKFNLLPCSVSLSEEEFAVLDAEYNEVVKYCHGIIVGIEKAEVNPRNIHFPTELVDLCSKIIESTKEDSVFLPYAGYCDMAFALESKSVHGFEADLSTVAFNTILFEAYGISGHISEGDSLAFELEEGQKYNHIISFPPHLSAKENRQIAQYMQDILQKNLAIGGDMILLLPLADMSSLPWTSFRRFLMENKTIYDALTISLPSVFLPTTGAKYCLMVIEKRDNPDGTFFFMDADRSEFFSVSKENRRQPLLKVESILESIKIRDEKYIREIDVENNDLFGKHYLLSFAPSRYFVYDNLPELKEGFEYFTLGELVKSLEIPGLAEGDIQYGRRPGQYIRISCLHDNYLSCDIDFKVITAAPIPMSAYCGYANGAYAAFVNGKIKVGQISGMYSSSGRLDDNDPYSDSNIIYIDGTVAHFAPRINGPAQQDYILRELMSDYVLNQAKKLAFGTLKQEMRESDFFKLKIAVPSIERQDEILKQDRIDAVTKAGVKLDEVNEKFKRDVHMMKHGLGQTVFNLGNWIKMLNYARKEGNGVVDDNAEIGGLVKVKVADIYDNIEASLKVLSRQITTFDIGDSMNQAEVSLTDFIDKYIEEHPRPHVRYDFPSRQHRADSDIPKVDIDNSDPNNPKVIEYPGEYVVRKGEATDYVLFSEEALSIIFENIISNAVVHGFTDPEKEYIIHIDFVPYGSSYVLTISNNGDPLPAGKDPSEVFIWGKTEGGKGHAGIGGYQIKDLMEHFGGKAEIISTPGQEYTVTYKLTFTKTNLLDVNL